MYQESRSCATLLEIFAMTLYLLEDQPSHFMQTPEHFLATKPEAFKSRSYSDPRQSRDFKDIVYVLENRNAIWSELANCNEPLKGYLRDEFGSLLAKKGIEEWIDCHIEFHSPPSTYLIIEELKKFTA